MPLNKPENIDHQPTLKKPLAENLSTKNETQKKSATLINSATQLIRKMSKEQTNNKTSLNKELKEIQERIDELEKNRERAHERLGGNLNLQQMNRLDEINSELKQLRLSQQRKLIEKKAIDEATFFKSPETYFKLKTLDETTLNKLYNYLWISGNSNEKNVNTIGQKLMQASAKLNLNLGINDLRIILNKLVKKSNDKRKGEIKDEIKSLEKTIEGIEARANGSLVGHEATRLDGLKKELRDLRQQLK